MKKVTIAFIEHVESKILLYTFETRRSTKILNILNFYFIKKCQNPQKLHVVSVYIHMVNLSASCFLTMLIRNSLLVGDYREHKQINKDWFNKLCFVNKQHQLRMPRPPITAYCILYTQPNIMTKTWDFLYLLFNVFLLS